MIDLALAYCWNAAPRSRELYVSAITHSYCWLRAFALALAHAGQSYGQTHVYTYNFKSTAGVSVS